MEDITNADYVHAKRVKNFEIRKLGKYHDLYIQGDTLLLPDVLYELDPAKKISAPGLAWQAALNSKVKLDLQADIDMLLMVEKGIRGGICHFIS